MSPQRKRSRRGGRGRGKKRSREEEESSPSGVVRFEWNPKSNEKKPIENLPIYEFGNGESPEAYKSLHDVWKKAKSMNEAIQEPSRIQKHVWSMLLDDKGHENAIIIAPTASGKTFSYALPLISSPSCAVLVVVPTRELAQQVADMSPRHGALKVQAWYGGKPLPTQPLAPPFLVCSTPGRLEHVIRETTVIESVHTVVLDEADKLAVSSDLASPISSTLEKLRPQKMILASATWEAGATKQWEEWLGPGLVSVCQLDTLELEGRRKRQTESDEAGDSVEPSIKATVCRVPDHVIQTVHVCSSHKKPKKLLNTLQKATPGKGMIFCAKIQTVKHIVKLLSKEKCIRRKILAMHSQLEQKERTGTLDTFRKHPHGLLVTTDLCARGVDIPNVEFVIQYDFPPSLEQYVHRCGRVGRNGVEGRVFGFFERKLANLAPDLIRLLKATNQDVDPNLLSLNNHDEVQKSTQDS